MLSDAQRASVTDPVIARLIDLIPRANFVDSSGTPRFIGSASAPVNVDQWTVDINYNLSERDRLHGYYAIQRAEWREPTRSGNTIPGFGNITRPLRQIFTLNETHIFGPNLVNEARLGFNRFSSTTTPNAQLNPADFGILNGISQPIGLPQINVAGGSSQFWRTCSPTVRTRRHHLCRCGQRELALRSAFTEVRWGVPAVSEQQFSASHRLVQLPDRRGLPGRHRKLFQRDAG